MNATITIRTDERLKRDAAALFSSLGLNLSTAINLFLTQAVHKQKFPLSLDGGVLGQDVDAANTYPADFFSLFGSGADLGLEAEPADLPAGIDREVLSL